MQRVERRPGDIVGSAIKGSKDVPRGDVRRARVPRDEELTDIVAVVSYTVRDLYQQHLHASLLASGQSPAGAPVEAHVTHPKLLLGTSWERSCQKRPSGNPVPGPVSRPVFCTNKAFATCMLL